MAHDLAKYIDQTLLKPEVGQADIIKFVTEAKSYQFASVCVHPQFVKISADILTSSSVAVCTVIGFPMGTNTTLTKVWETRDAIANGAEELDMVIPIGALRSGDFTYVQQDIAAVKAAAGDLVVKVILETAYLTESEIVNGCLIAKLAGADFVKTSTGLAHEGATIPNVELMRATVGKDYGVKAAGGIRDQKTALAMIKAGANRLGTSAGVAIVQGDEGDSHGY